jgi:hypothetical protein
MKTKDVIDLKFFLREQGHPVNDNAALREIVNHIRALNCMLTYCKHGTFAFEAHKKEHGYTFKPQTHYGGVLWPEIETEPLTVPKWTYPHPGKAWYTGKILDSDFYTAVTTGKCHVKGGPTLVDKDWDLSKYDLIKAKKDELVDLKVAEYKKKLAELGPLNDGDTVEMKWDIRID